jgi:hypothetical protein
MPYRVVINHCTCRPETCCCNDYAVVDDLGTKLTTCFRRYAAEAIVEALNAKEKQ